MVDFITDSVDCPFCKGDVDSDRMFGIIEQEGRIVGFYHPRCVLEDVINLQGGSYNDTLRDSIDALLVAYDKLDNEVAKYNALIDSDDYPTQEQDDEEEAILEEEAGWY